MVHGDVCVHVLHRVVPHGSNPILRGEVEHLALTRTFLRLEGLRKDTRGGWGMAFLHRSDVLRIGRNVWMIL